MQGHRIRQSAATRIVKQKYVENLVENKRHNKVENKQNQHTCSDWFAAAASSI